MLQKLYPDSYEQEYSRLISYIKNNLLEVLDDMEYKEKKNRGLLYVHDIVEFRNTQWEVIDVGIGSATIQCISSGEKLTGISSCSEFKILKPSPLRKNDNTKEVH